MGRSRVIVAIVLVLAVSLLVAPKTARAQNASGGLTVLTFPGADSSNCGTLRALGQITVNGPSTFVAQATDANGTVVHSVTGAISDDPSRPFPRVLGSYGGVFQTAPARNPIRLVVAIDGVVVADLTANNPCFKPVAGVTFFNPGDKRIDPRPGDRIAVYCDPPDIVVVWGIDNASRGFPLATFSLQELLAAGPRGLRENAGSNGSVSASVDRHLNLCVGWAGGPYSANAEGDFAKSLNCNGRVPGAAQPGSGTMADGRADPRPGDRIAVYCDGLDTLVVWGIDYASKGFPLTTFSYRQLRRAGSRGLTQRLGNLGSVSASVDNQNNFWVAWHGGPLRADGVADLGFAKGFQCRFAS